MANNRSTTPSWFTGPKMTMFLSSFGIPNGSNSPPRTVGTAHARVEKFVAELHVSRASSHHHWFSNPGTWLRRQMRSQPRTMAPMSLCSHTWLRARVYPHYFTRINQDEGLANVASSLLSASSELDVWGQSGAMSGQSVYEREWVRTHQYP
jgi:hypothetical protein